MTPDTLQYYAPCEKHEWLWHDTSQACYYCLIERVRELEIHEQAQVEAVGMENEFNS